MSLKVEYSLNKTALLINANFTAILTWNNYSLRYSQLNLIEKSKGENDACVCYIDSVYSYSYNLGMCIPVISEALFHL